MLLLVFNMLNKTCHTQSKCIHQLPPSSFLPLPIKTQLCLFETYQKINVPIHTEFIQGKAILWLVLMLYGRQCKKVTHTHSAQKSQKVIYSLTHVNNVTRHPVLDK
jgi:hypothetical protein